SRRAGAFDRSTAFLDLAVDRTCCAVGRACLRLAARTRSRPAAPGGGCLLTDTDVINTLAGLAPRSQLALIRDGKPVTRENAQASFRALFESAEPGAVA